MVAGATGQWLQPRATAGEQWSASSACTALGWLALHSISRLSLLLSLYRCVQSGAGGKVLEVVKARHAYSSTVADQMSFAAVSTIHRHRPLRPVLVAEWTRRSEIMAAQSHLSLCTCSAVSVCSLHRRAT